MILTENAELLIHSAFAQFIDYINALQSAQIVWFLLRSPESADGVTSTPQCYARELRLYAAKLTRQAETEKKNE